MGQRMSTNKSPAFQFYPRDWLSDANLMLLEWGCRGMHLHLLCIAWFQDPPGTLPNDDVQLMKFLGMSSTKNTCIRKFKDELKAQILINFRIDEGSSSPTYNRWVHDELVAKFQGQKAYKESRARNANKRWEKKHMDCTCTSEQEHMQCSASTPAPSSSSSSSSAVGKDIKNISLPKKTIVPANKIDIPEWINQEDWVALLDHRKSVRSPINDKSQKLIIEKLKRFKEQGMNVSDVIKESIINGWKGIFPIQNNLQKDGNHGQKRKSNAAIHFDSCKDSLKGTKYDSEYDSTKDPFGAKIS